MITERAKVIMLPTENKPEPAIFKYLDGSLGSLATEFKRQPATMHHLYVTVDDEIEEGDQYYHSKWREVFKLYDTTNEAFELKYARKIIATTDPKLELPQPSQAFIEKYSELGGIDEVDVELESVCIGQEPSGAHGLKDIWVTNLKLNSHNEIVIHSIKDSWTREEMIKAWDDGSSTGIKMGLGRDFYQTKEEWIKENL